MKNETTTVRRVRRLVNATLGAALLMAMAGCCCHQITIYNTGAPGHSGSGAPAGGNFVPVQAILASGTTVTICGQPVSGKYVRFYPPTQIPNTGDTGFRGRLWNVTTSSDVPNTAYYLQWFVTAANTGCATPVANSTTDVSCPVTPGLTYRFIAHFKTGQVPPTGSTIQLLGAWTQ